jgi:large subunit ribosomal protein L19
MSSELIDIAERSCLKSDVPEFHIGDTVEVSCRIVEGGRRRAQVFIGVVIARRGHGLNETFTVRRIVNNEGVERIFMLHSPLIVGIKVTRRGKVRRAKLYFLRGRVGKAQRLRERRIASASKRTTEKRPEEAATAAAGEKADQ